MRRREVLKASAWLLGTAVSASVSRALLADELSITGNGAFTDEQLAAVELLSDMIIPTTDTPGAVAAGVPDFIATIFQDWYRQAEQESFLADSQRWMIFVSNTKESALTRLPQRRDWRHCKARRLSPGKPCRHARVRSALLQPARMPRSLRD